MSALNLMCEIGDCENFEGPVRSVVPSRDVGCFLSFLAGFEWVGDGCGFYSFDEVFSQKTGYGVCLLAWGR